MREQVLGDTDGDLGDAMQVAEEQGKQERKEDKVKGEGGSGSKDDEGVKQQADSGDGKAQGVKEAGVGDKRKRDDGDQSMEVEESAKKTRTHDAEMQVDVRTEDGE
jgi:hypothetical protein